MTIKKEQLSRDIAQAVGAGKAASLETVDFSDPNRPKTCLEVDFPILPINQVAAIEGNAGKPIYQMSKWWARRRSSVFRSMLIAAATKAPSDSAHAAKLVWDNYYANHQKKGSFSQLKVADIFMGGGTTLVEGSRLGMQMIGNDLNPVAWFVVKQELADVDLNEVKRLLADIEAEVKPQIMPYYYCDGPNGEKGIWTHLPTGNIMPTDFDPLTLTLAQRPEYSYRGSEIIYTFWGKHGPCQVIGCGHRTPIMSSPVMAVKILTVKSWEHTCPNCAHVYDIEESAARMAPNVPMYVAPDEAPYAVLDLQNGTACPNCAHTERAKVVGKGKKKKITLSLLVHPAWLKGSPRLDVKGQTYGGAAQDDAESTARWSKERAAHIRLLEVRGELPEEVTCPETGVKFRTDEGTVPKKSSFACGSCGTPHDVLTAIRSTGKTGQMAGYAIQGYEPARAAESTAYNGRFFAPFDTRIADQYNAAILEWEERKNTDLADYWPRSEVPFGFMTHMNNGGIPNHGFTHWWMMFNPRQLLVHTQLLKAIVERKGYDLKTREYVLGAFQQYLRNQSMFTMWNIQGDKLEPQFANNNYHPKATVVENCVFPNLGRGNWTSCIEGIVEGRMWAEQPWDSVSAVNLSRKNPELAQQITGKSEKAFPGDTLKDAVIYQGSSTDLAQIPDANIDLVITDPPFGGLLHYSELADFFYVWLRLVLKDEYPAYFKPDYTPKSLEAVSNRAREPENPDSFYQRVLTQCWREAHRVLKPGGMLAFTFHHSADEPWVSVLESLFNAGFYLEATYPIRSDETKGAGAKPGTFGSQTIEYDIIHVCRKRSEKPRRVSWSRMRREVMADVQQLQGLLENHAREGLPAADLQVIRRGKALEYFSRHYGEVYLNDDELVSVRDALIGINQLMDDTTEGGLEPPPVDAEPMTRQFLRTFGQANELKRDQLQKFLRGSITTPDDFVGRGWCIESNKVFTRVSSLSFAKNWSGKHRRKLTSDLDQAMVLAGACYEGSGISAMDTLRNENFKLHTALRPLLEWLSRNGPDDEMRQGAKTAVAILENWQRSQRFREQQPTLLEVIDS
ncbi:site-specific DNA-methyltransferase [Deinococcus aquatilis]|uniref:site-specific DNA-methyltransferase n=1 Tax=Deinococcus aquatilis TaxID=519440 RepID=UPI000370F15B|nr:site-specific DNA-methyltransferase [Deinococcus aquatilis]